MSRATLATSKRFDHSGRHVAHQEGDYEQKKTREPGVDVRARHLVLGHRRLLTEGIVVGFATTGRETEANAGAMRNVQSG